MAPSEISAEIRQQLDTFSRRHNRQGDCHSSEFVLTLTRAKNVKVHWKGVGSGSSASEDYLTREKSERIERFDNN